MSRSIVTSLVLGLFMLLPGGALAADPTPVSYVRVSVAPVSTNVGVETTLKATVSTSFNSLTGGVVNIPLPDALAASAVAISGAGGTCSIVDNDVTCTDVALGMYGSRVISITVTPAVVGEHVLAASVTADHGLVDQASGRGSTVGRVTVWPTSHRDVGMSYAYTSGGVGGADVVASTFNKTGIATNVTVTATRTGTGDISAATFGGVPCTVTASSAVCSTSISAWSTRQINLQLTGAGQAQGTIQFVLATSDTTDVNDYDNAYPTSFSFDGSQRSVGIQSASASSSYAGNGSVYATIYNQSAVPTTTAFHLTIDGPATIASASVNGQPCTVTGGQTVDCTSTLGRGVWANVYVTLTGTSTDQGTVTAEISAPGYTDLYTADDQRSFTYRLDGVPTQPPPPSGPPPTQPAMPVYLYAYPPSGAIRGTRLTFDAPFSAYPLSQTGLTATINAPGAALQQPPAPFDSCGGVGTATLVCAVGARSNSYTTVPMVGTVADGTAATDVTVTLSGGTAGTQSASSRIVQRLSGTAGLRALVRAGAAVKLDGTNPGTTTVTLGAFNAAPTAAQDATAQLPLPTGIMPDIALLPIGCTWNAPTIACDLGDVPAYEYATFDVTLNVAAGLYGGRRLTTTISAVSGLGAASDDVRRATLSIQNALLDRVTTQVQLSLPNLATTGSAWQPLSDHVARVGEHMLVRIDVSRTYLGAPRPGLNPTTARVVLPPNLAFVAGEAGNSSSFACSASDQLVTCPLGLTGYTSTRGTNESGTLELLVDASAPGIGSIQAFVDDEQLPDDAYTATQALLLEVSAATGGDLSTRPVFGDANVNETARLVVPFHNLRTGTATDAVATISIPTGVSIAGVAPTQGACATVAQDLVCELGDVPGGHGGVINLEVVASAAGRYELVTTLESTSTDPVPNNDMATSTFVASGPNSVQLWGAPMMRLNVGTTGLAKLSGQALPAGVHDVEVSVQLPANVGFVGSDAASCVAGLGRVVTCLVPKAAQDTDGVYAVSMTLRGEAVGEADVASWATSPTAPQATWGGAFSAFRVVVGAGSERDLVTALKVAKEPVRIGARTSVQFSVRNRSTLDAANAVGTITLPAGVTHVVSGGPVDACAVAGQVLTCSFGTIPAGEYTSIDAVVQVNARPAGPISAQITASGSDLDPSDDSASAVLPVRDTTASADLQTQALTSCRTGVMESCVVAARVRNLGGASTTAGTLTVTIPVQVTVDYWKIGSGTCTESATTLSCSLGTVEAGAIVELRMGVSPNAAGRFELGLDAQSTTPVDVDAANGAASIGVIGTGALIGSAPASSTFADTGAGSRRGMAVTVTNLGASTQRLVPQVGGVDASAFTIDRGCHRVLFSGDSCTAIVTFAPGAVRAFAAQLALLDPYNFPLRLIPLAGNGIATSAPTTESPVEPGGTVTTAPTADGATASTPVVVAVTSPVAGTVVVQDGTTSTTAPSGYALLGRELTISAPAASSTSDPLRLTFTLDAASIPAGTDTSLLRVLRNGTAVTEACIGGVAFADRPCEFLRQTLDGGDLQIVVLTMNASYWVFARTPAPPADSDGDGLVNANDCAPDDSSKPNRTGTDANCDGVVDIITPADSDGDGLVDASDCAPNDAAKPNRAGTDANCDGVIDTTTTTTNPTPDPVATPLATKFATVTARVVKFRCVKPIDKRSGIRVGTALWCFKLVTSAKLVETATGKVVSGQSVRVQRLVGTRRVLVGTAITKLTGVASITRPIVVPTASRRSLTLATRWLAVQYAKTAVTHLRTGTRYAPAAARTVKIVR